MSYEGSGFRVWGYEGVGSKITTYTDFRSFPGTHCRVVAGNAWPVLNYGLSFEDAPRTSCSSGSASWLLTSGLLFQWFWIRGVEHGGTPSDSSFRLQGLSGFCAL